MEMEGICQSDNNPTKEQKMHMIFNIWFDQNRLL